MSKLSENIKNLRLMRGLTQKKLAEKIGRAPNTIANWEKGVISPDADALAPLCEVLNVNPNQLLGWEVCPDLELFLQDKQSILLEIESLKSQKADIDKRLKAYNDKLKHRG